MLIDELAEQVRLALESEDLAGFAGLLDPDVRWAAPGDDVYGCHNRRQVINWYQQGRNKGTRATVSEVVTGDGKLLVGMRVRGSESEADPPEDNRWQVLTVRDGRIADIRGYDNRTEAAGAAGVPA